MRAAGLMTIFLLSSLHGGGYLESLLGGTKNEKVKTVEKKHTLKDRNITSEEEMSRVLLSFEKEAEQEAVRLRKLEEAKKAEEARKKAEEEKKRREAEQKEAEQRKHKSSFPTLEEQLADFGHGDEQAINPMVQFDENGKRIVKPKPKPPIYGIFCKKDKCYALGNHRIYKEGDSVNGIKIMEITKNFIRYKNGKKEWYTR